MATEKRLIDANALLEELDKFANPMPNKSGYDFLCGISTAITEIEDAPTVDAVEVVRCKDCKYYTEQEKRCDHPCQDWDVECYDQWLEMAPNDFCSYGERRKHELEK